MKYEPPSPAPVAMQDLKVTGLKIYCHNGKSVRQTAESDVSDIPIKAFRWLVSFGDDVVLWG